MIFKKVNLLVSVSILLFLFGCTGEVNTKKNTNSSELVEALISKMTIEEKVGQMTQLTLSMFYKDGKLLENKLKNYITKNNIGSILNVDKSKPFTLKEWHKLITTIQDYANKSRLKIPVLYGIDAIHGATYTDKAVLFPHNIGMAATRNPALVHEIATITAKEVRASGIRWNFDPVLGVGRQPLWSRFEETFGEDSYLVSEFGVQAIKGYEGNDVSKNTQVASCMKHFIGYSVPKNGKDRTPAYISDAMFYDVFIPPFKKAVEAGSKTIMINSGSINGIPVHTNKALLTDLLKDKWGFEGLVVTDWEDILYLYEEHKVAKNNKDAVKIAINAGVDMSMVPHKLTFYHDLIALVNEGEVSMERINDAVRRILTVKQQLGLFENPYPEKEAVTNYNLEVYKETALKSAQESITLLKNDTLNNQAILPLSKNTKVLIAGPCANALSPLHGSWSFTWQGNREFLYPETTLTIKEAIEHKISRNNLINIAPKTFKKVSETDIAKLKEQAKKVDYIILCLGENSYAETKGNIDDLTLSKDQLELAKAVIETKKPIILVLTEGRPRIISEISKDIQGIIMAYRPSSEGAHAISDVLFGDYNPSGKLPFSYPRFTGNIITYDAPARNQKLYNPQWEFGYGLSYTTFEFKNLELSSHQLVNDESLTIKITVKNTGDREGKVGIDLFIKDKVASIIPPMKKLRKFTKIKLKSNQSKQAEFTITKDDLSFVNAQLKTVTEDGDFELMIGDKKANFTYKN